MHSCGDESKGMVVFLVSLGHRKAGVPSKTIQHFRVDQGWHRVRQDLFRPPFRGCCFFLVQMWSRRVGTEPPTKRRTDDAMSALLPRAVKRPELQWRGRLGSWRESSGAPARDSKANRADRTFWCSHVGLHFLLWPQKVIAGYFQVPKKVWVLGQGSKLLVTWVLNHLKVPQSGFHLAINYVAYTTIG